MAEIELSADGTEHAEVAFDLVMDAIAAASDQDRATWVLVDGKRVAAVVPVDHVPDDVRREIHSIAAELSRERPFSERVELTTRLLDLYDRPRLPEQPRLQGEWHDVGRTEDARAVTLVIGEQLARDLGYEGSWPRGVLDPPSSRDPEGQG